MSLLCQKSKICHFFPNPLSGNKGLRSLNKLTDRLVTKNLSYDIYRTEINLAVTEKNISEKLNGYSDIVSVGGDGRLNMLSNVLAFKKIPWVLFLVCSGQVFLATVLYSIKYFSSATFGAKPSLCRCGLT